MGQDHGDHLFEPFERIHRGSHAHARAFWNAAAEDEAVAPLVAVANRYCDRPPCPTKDWEERERVGLVARLAAEWDCRGAVVLRQSQCGPHEVDIPTVRAALEAGGVPVLVLDSDGSRPASELEARTEEFLVAL